MCTESVIRKTAQSSIDANWSDCWSMHEWGTGMPNQIDMHEIKFRSIK